MIESTKKQKYRQVNTGSVSVVNTYGLIDTVDFTNILMSSDYSSSVEPDLSLDLLFFFLEAACRFFW